MCLKPTCVCVCDVAVIRKGPKTFGLLKMNARGMNF